MDSQIEKQLEHEMETSVSYGPYTGNTRFPNQRTFPPLMLDTPIVYNAGMYRVFFIMTGWERVVIRGMALNFMSSQPPLATFGHALLPLQASTPLTLVNISIVVHYIIPGIYNVRGVGVLILGGDCSPNLVRWQTGSWTVGFLQTGQRGVRLSGAQTEGESFQWRLPHVKHSAVSFLWVLARAGILLAGLTYNIYIYIHNYSNILPQGTTYNGMLQNKLCAQTASCRMGKTGLTGFHRAIGFGEDFGNKY